MVKLIVWGDSFMNDFFLKKKNFTVNNEHGKTEKGIFYDGIFEFENKIFNLSEYGYLKSEDDIERLVENLELLYKYKILWNTIKED